MPEEERSVAQVRKVYELLVRPHPNYGDFRTEHGWAFARKVTTPGERTVITEVIVDRQHYGLGAFAESVLPRVRNRLHRRSTS